MNAQQIKLLFTLRDPADKPQAIFVVLVTVFACAAIVMLAK